MGIRIWYGREDEAGAIESWYVSSAEDTTTASGRVMARMATEGFNLKCKYYRSSFNQIWQLIGCGPFSKVISCATYVVNKLLLLTLASWLSSVTAADQRLYSPLLTLNRLGLLLNGGRHRLRLRRDDSLLGLNRQVLGAV